MVNPSRRVAIAERTIAATTRRRTRPLKRAMRIPGVFRLLVLSAARSAVGLKTLAACAFWETRSPAISQGPTRGAAMIFSVRLNRHNSSRSSDPCWPAGALHVQVLYVEGVLLDEFAAAFDVLAHERGKDLFAFDGVFQTHLEERALFRVHGGFS